MNRLAKTLADTATRMFFRSAHVGAVTAHGTQFREIELTGDALRGVTWNVGDKVQVRTDPDELTVRTYTPISWDSARGATRLMAYAHGDGPGSTWARTVAQGDSCEFFGPRRSLKIGDPLTPLIFVGDETSFALAAAWRSRHPASPPIAELFEVNDPDDSGIALDAMGLSLSELFTRDHHGAHLDQLSTTLVGLLRAHDDATVCLTGKAQSIATLRKDLKSAGLSRRPVRVKAYWDENRTGLD